MAHFIAEALTGYDEKADSYFIIRDGIEELIMKELNNHVGEKIED